MMNKFHVIRFPVDGFSLRGRRYRVRSLIKLNGRPRWQPIESWICRPYVSLDRGRIHSFFASAFVWNGFVKIVYVCAPNVAAAEDEGRAKQQECQNNDECILTPSLNQFREIFVNRRKPLWKCASFRAFLSFSQFSSLKTLQMPLVIDCILCCADFFLSRFSMPLFCTCVCLCVCLCVKCLLLCHSIRFDSFYCGWLWHGWLPQSYTITCIRCMLFASTVYFSVLASFEGNLSLRLLCAVRSPPIQPNLMWFPLPFARAVLSLNGR